jgi:radical SAM protein with 4Fe4S-binding SPASM domain
MPLDLLRKLLRLLPGVRVVNLGTGECGLHPQFTHILEELLMSAIAVGLTTNGYTALSLSDDLLRKLNDVDFSLDFPDRDTHNSFRGSGVFESVLKGIARCRRLNVEASIVMTLMSINCRHLPGMIRLARRLNTNLRINIYKPVATRRFVMGFEDFWTSVRVLADEADWMSCSEPIIRAFVRPSSATDFRLPCGETSLRVTPEGALVPCVYLRPDDGFSLALGTLEAGETATLEQTIRAFHRVPSRCTGCSHVSACHGGCAARRFFSGGLDVPDEYCPVGQWDQNQTIGVNWVLPESKPNLVHSDYLCTTIVR